MKIYGLIAEFDPLHNGHKRLLDDLKSSAQEVAIIAVISGPFTQRGNPSFFTKWEKASMALRSGVDLVIELPQIYATASAEEFAKGGIKVLKATGIINALAFGSESGNTHRLKEMAFFINHQQAYQLQLRDCLSNNLPYHIAQQAVLRNTFQVNLQNTPNDRLGLAYLTQIPQNWHVRTLKRDHSHHSDFSSSYIRKLLLLNETQAIHPLVPTETWSIIEQKKQAAFPDMTIFLPTLKIQALKPLPKQSDGWEEKLRASILQAKDWDDILLSATTKHYTKARIARILLNMLLDPPMIAKNEIPYLRILGFNRQGSRLLKQIKRHSSSPILTNIGRQQEMLTPSQKSMLEFDIARNNLADMTRNNGESISFSDYYRHPIMINDSFGRNATSKSSTL